MLKEYQARKKEFVGFLCGSKKTSKVDEQCLE